MKNRIALKAEPRRTAIVLLIFTIISLFLILVLVFSVNKDCMQFNSLIQSSYDFSVTTQEPVLENDYYQFNAGIDFAISADSQTSLNADIIMQTDKSAYTDLVYWNTNALGTHGIAVSKNIAKSNNLHLGDKLYSKHIVNGEIYEYSIEQIIPETVCVRTDKGKRYSNGIDEWLPRRGDNSRIFDAKSRPGKFSGGEQRLLQVFSVIATRSDSDLLIIDEPLNNLDFVNARHISNIINKVIRDNPQMGVLMISHCRIFPFISRELKLTSDGISEVSDPYICHSCFGEPDENGFYK